MDWRVQNCKNTAHGPLLASLAGHATENMMDSDGPTSGKPSATRFMQDAEVSNWLDNAAKHWRRWLVVLIVAVVGIYYFAGRNRTDSSAVSQSAMHPVVPVAAAPAKLGDLKQYISAIG